MCGWAEFFLKNGKTFFGVKRVYFFVARKKLVILHFSPVSQWKIQICSGCVKNLPIPNVRKVDVRCEGKSERKMSLEYLERQGNLLLSFLYIFLLLPHSYTVSHVQQDFLSGFCFIYLLYEKFMRCESFMRGKEFFN